MFFSDVFKIHSSDRESGRLTLLSKAGKLRLSDVHDLPPLLAGQEVTLGLHMGSREVAPPPREPQRQFPSLGRVIHAFEGDRWFPAIVTAVHGELCVDAVLFPGGREQTSLTRVDEGEAPYDLCWRWPPRVTSYEDYLESVALPGNRGRVEAQIDARLADPTRPVDHLVEFTGVGVTRLKPGEREQLEDEERHAEAELQEGLEDAYEGQGHPDGSLDQGR